MDHQITITIDDNTMSALQGMFCEDRITSTAYTGAAHDLGRAMAALGLQRVRKLKEHGDGSPEVQTFDRDSYNPVLTGRQVEVALLSLHVLASVMEHLARPADGVDDPAIEMERLIPYSVAKIRAEVMPIKNEIRAGMDEVTAVLQNALIDKLVRVPINLTHMQCGAIACAFGTFAAVMDIMDEDDEDVDRQTPPA